MQHTARQRGRPPMVKSATQVATKRSEREWKDNAQIITEAPGVSSRSPAASVVPGLVVSSRVLYTSNEVASNEASNQAANKN